MAKILMLTAMAAANFSFNAGSIAEVPDDQAKAWCEAGLATEAPGEHVAADRIARLEAELGNLRTEVVPLRQAKVDLDARLAGAAAERKGGDADRKALQRATDAAIAQAADAGAQLTAARAQIGTLAAERDQALGQARELGEQLAAALADLAAARAATAPAGATS